MVIMSIYTSIVHSSELDSDIHLDGEYLEFLYVVYWPILVTRKGKQIGKQ
jgi:hypothetical protein